ITWTEPVWLAKVTRPSTTGTTTMLEIVCPAPKLRFETPGSGRPCGWTVRYPPAEGAVTVTLSTTAVTPEEGTPAVPVTGRLTRPPGATTPGRAPSPLRVSSSRSGPAGVKVEPVA